MTARRTIAWTIVIVLTVLNGVAAAGPGTGLGGGMA